MQACGTESLGDGVKILVDDVGRQDVGCVRIRVAKEVGEADGGKGVIVVEGVLVELDHNRERVSSMVQWFVEWLLRSV